MIKLKIFLCFWGLVHLVDLSAQPLRFSYLMDNPKIVYSFRNLNNFEVIDSTRYRVVYDFVVSVDSMSQSSQMILDVGAKYTNYYNWAERYIDSVCTAKYGTSPVNAVNEYSGDEQIIRNNLTDETECYNRLPFVLERVLVYQDTPKINWELIDRTDSIAGYLCYAAKTKFRGRTWQVWYTTDIPEGYGPWKFGGLSGLVMQAEDSQGDYKWQCSGIVQRIVPIKKYRWAISTITRVKWLKMERNIMRNPLLYASGENIRLLQIVNNESRPISEPWSISYNPLELE